MKDYILVVYFTRTGRSEKVALEFNKHYKCMMEEITEEKNRSGIVGYVLSAWQGIRKKTSIINKVKYNPKDFNMTIIITCKYLLNTQEKLENIFLVNYNLLYNSNY